MAVDVVYWGKEAQNRYRVWGWPKYWSECIRAEPTSKVHALGLTGADLMSKVHALEINWHLKYIHWGWCEVCIGADLMSEVHALGLNKLCVSNFYTRCQQTSACGSSLADNAVCTANYKVRLTHLSDISECQLVTEDVVCCAEAQHRYRDWGQLEIWSSCIGADLRCEELAFGLNIFSVCTRWYIFAITAALLIVKELKRSLYTNLPLAAKLQVQKLKTY